MLTEHPYQFQVPLGDVSHAMFPELKIEEYGVYYVHKSMYQDAVKVLGYWNVRLIEPLDDNLDSLRKFE